MKKQDGSEVFRPFHSSFRLHPSGGCPVFGMACLIWRKYQAGEMERRWIFLKNRVLRPFGNVARRLLCERQCHHLLIPFIKK
jgi:hypothetical protein